MKFTPIDSAATKAARKESMAERASMLPITREVFLGRFKTRLRDLLGEHYDFKYVDEIAPTYWDDPMQRREGPEECAEAEASEWGRE